MQDDEEYQDTLDCSKCGQSVEEILALQCVHNLCLMCAAKTLHTQARQEPANLNSVKCEICGVVTILEASSAQVLGELLTLNHASPSQYAYSRSQNAQGAQLDLHQQQPPQLQQQQQQQFANQRRGVYSPLAGYQHGTGDANVTPSGPRQGALGNASSNLKDSLHTVVLDHHTQSDPNLRSQVVCRDHPQEDAILYCYTCETPCICVECCLNGLHKGHDLRNVHKNYDALAGSVEELRFKLRTRTDVLLNDESRLTQKKREMVEVVAQAKQHIKASFEELMQALENKQRELLASAEELMEEKFTDVDRHLQRVRAHARTLQEYDRNLETLYCAGLANTVPAVQSSSSSSSPFTPEQQVRAYNYYADNKQKMLQQMHDMDVSFFQQVQERMQTQFALDMQSLYQHIDSVRMIKFEIISLRGLESAAPSVAEQALFERAKEERNRRRFTQKSTLFQQNNADRSDADSPPPREDNTAYSPGAQSSPPRANNAQQQQQQQSVFLRDSRQRQNEVVVAPQRTQSAQSKQTDLEFQRILEKSNLARQTTQEKENVVAAPSRTQEKIAALRKTFAALQ